MIKKIKFIVIYFKFILGLWIIFVKINFIEVYVVEIIFLVFREYR